MDTAANTPLAILMILAILIVTMLLILVITGLHALILGRDVICKWTVPVPVLLVIEIVTAAARMRRDGTFRRSINPQPAMRLLRHRLRPGPSQRTILAFRKAIPAPRPTSVPHYLTVGERFRQRRAA